jgi:hypothetical protein
LLLCPCEWSSSESRYECSSNEVSLPTFHINTPFPGIPVVNYPSYEAFNASLQEKNGGKINLL